MRSVTASPTAAHHSSATPRATATKSAHATSSPSSGSSKSGSFTVPAIPGDNIVTGYGSYSKPSSVSVKVTICVKQTGKAYAVGAEAVAYNSSGATKNIGAVVITGSGQTSSCSSITFLFYTAHLKVHAFIGDHGTIVKTGPVETLY